MVFAWVALYGLTYILAEQISQILHPADWIVPLAMTVYVGFLILWIYRTGQCRKIGFCTVRNFRPKQYLYCLPLLVLPLYNLMTVQAGVVTFSTCVRMVCVSVAEEIFFRGFLLHYLSKQGLLRGILAASAIFAVFHCVNLFRSAEPLYTLMQILCAFAVGICYCAIVIKGNSLFPGMFAHCLTNITAIGVDTGWRMPGLWLCIGVHVCYGIWLCRRIR